MDDDLLVELVLEVIEDLRPLHGAVPLRDGDRGRSLDKVPAPRKIHTIVVRMSCAGRLNAWRYVRVSLVRGHALRLEPRGDGGRALPARCVHLVLSTAIPLSSLQPS